MGIKRRMIMPLGTTGYTTMLQKMLKFSLKSWVRCVASGMVPFKTTGVTGVVVMPMLNPASFKPFCNALVIVHNLFFNSGCVRIISRRLIDPTTNGIGNALA